MGSLWNPTTSTIQRRTLQDSGKTVAYAGASYGHVSQNRGFFGSLFDTERIKHNTQMMSKLNPAASKRLKIGDAGTTINIDKKLFLADDQGYITVVNQTAMEEKLAYIKQSHEYVSMLMEYMVYTDELAAEAMGLEMTVYDELFKAGSRSVNGQTMPDFMIGTEARASYIQSLPESSTLYVASLAKIRFIVSHLLPVFEKIKTDSEAANI